MRTLLSILIALLFSNLTIAQTTAIPDANFEQELINIGLDATLDGQVLTAHIDTLTALNIQGASISNLTGIEDFIALTFLNCIGNQLTSLNVIQHINLITLWCNNNLITNLDVTQNIHLTSFSCGNNQLTSLDVTQNTSIIDLQCSYGLLNSLDVSQNPNLTNLHCSYNNISNIDLSQNTQLEYLYINNNQLPSLNLTMNTALFWLYASNNQLSSLDVSQNSFLADIRCNSNQLLSINTSGADSLKVLSCHSNLLTELNISSNPLITSLHCAWNNLSCLNVKNGNNSNFSYFTSLYNPSLTCIDVDNTAWSTTSWTLIDNQTSFNTNCPNPCAVGIEELNSNTLQVAPNPTSGLFTITLVKGHTNSVSIRNSLGQLILIEKHTVTDKLELDISAFPNGIYFLQLEVEGEVITKKIIKE
jgi:Leucine-rich repeat (LRR) protein